MALAIEGWRARLELDYERGPRRTVLRHCQHVGPLSVQRPFYPEDDVCHTYLLHPPGGVVGGDELAVALNVGDDASALVTTPGATKFYRSNGPVARVQQTLHVETNASLEWFPLENIFFPGAVVDTHTTVSLGAGAEIALWEVHCFGRPVIGERFDHGRVDASLSIHRESKPMLLERQRIYAPHGARRSMLGRFAVTGIFVASQCDETGLEAARDALTVVGANEWVGATLLDQQCLVVRYLGDSTESARRIFGSVWANLRPLQLERPACPPRIWAT